MSRKGRKVGKKIGAYAVPYFGTTIAKDRERTGLTQEQLAALCGVSVRTLRAHEKSELFKREIRRRVHAKIVATLAGLERPFKTGNKNQV